MSKKCFCQNKNPQNRRLKIPQLGRRISIETLVGSRRVQSDKAVHGDPATRIQGQALQNPIARKVKIADVQDNMDLSRIPDPTEKEVARVEEYRAVLKLLTESDLPEHS